MIKQHVNNKRNKQTRTTDFWIKSQEELQNEDYMWYENYSNEDQPAAIMKGIKTI